MMDMSSIERAVWLNDLINDWLKCCGCGPLGVHKAGINGFTFCGCKAVFIEVSESMVAFVLYSETGEKVAEYHLNIETGMAVMIEDKTYLEDSYTDYRGMLADILNPIFNDDNDDAVFTLVNEPVRIDTTIPPIKPMSMEEIFKDIIKRITEDNEED